MPGKQAALVLRPFRPAGSTSCFSALPNGLRRLTIDAVCQPALNPDVSGAEPRKASLGRWKFSAAAEANCCNDSLWPRRNNVCLAELLPPPSLVESRQN